MAKKLRFHDEKTYNFWGGLYEGPENVSDDTDDEQFAQVAAICEHPDAERRARLFCGAEALIEVATAEDLLAGYDMTPDELRVWEQLRAAIASAKGENNG